MSNTLDLVKLTVADAAKMLDSKQISATELTQESLRCIKAREPEINAFISVTEEIALTRSKHVDADRATGKALSALAGIPYSLKDVYNVVGTKTTAGSKILESYTSVYDATVERKLQEAQGVLIGKTNCDSFGFGSTGEHSAFGPTKNPINTTLVPGGSSSGSGAAVAYGGGLYSIGEDTGGSIRCPAAFCNIVGLKPTYGRVSRYGAIAYASSYDSIGPMTKSVQDAAIVLQHIAGKDPYDATTGESAVPEYTAYLENSLHGKKIGLPKEYFVDGLDPLVRQKIMQAVEVYTSLGAEIIEISLPNTEHAIAAYYIVGISEASSNLGRMDGIRFGTEVEGKNWSEKIKNARGIGFNDEAKRRIMVGTYALSAGYADQFYKKAQQVRKLLKKEFLSAFSLVDIILTPTMPVLPPKIGEDVNDPLKLWLMDAFTVSVNPVGVPALSVPVDKNDVSAPVGMQLIAPHFKEEVLFNFGHLYEKEVYAS
ncbi:MAG: Asp-tRNA(Asn)/Glu-tRNA(Gln) amidotransferase subunit GatA [Candidatus Dojkabacteria bacterium]|nr:MAG: Asp-tRNA(Asn)/Glu-tRNA(Gln) amidotransferase subunit GatA [Candidatus Dojkabacteria bacterium]